MVKRKQSRVASRAKPIQPKLSHLTSEENTEYDKELHLKRLDDFDRQVQAICEKMEKERLAAIATIENLYFTDEQRTPAAVNNMLWLDYLSKNGQNFSSKSVLRPSITALVDHTIADTVKLVGKKKPAADQENFAVPRTTRKRNVPQTSNTEFTPATSTRSRRGQKCEVQSTPVNPGISQLPSILPITPKFDPRTPLLPNTLRKPRFGEIAISLKGSPLQTGLKAIQLDDIKEEEIDEKTKAELLDIHGKVSKIFGLI